MKDKFLSKAVPRGTRTIWRYLGALIILFTFAIGQMWADSVTFSAADMSEQTSGAKKGKITVYCPTKAGDQQAYKSGSAVKHNAISLNSSADTAVIVPQSGKSVQFRADANYKITGISIFAAANKDSICGEPIVIWAGAVNNTPAYVGTIEAPSRAGTSDPDPIVVTGIPNNATAFALYRRIKYNSSTGVIGSGSNFGRSQQTWNIFSVTVTYESTTPATTYTVTYSAGDGSVKEGKSLPTQAAVAAGTIITLASADDLEKEGKEFDGWLCNINSTKYAAGASYTMTAAATTFTAQWQDPAPKYTVTLMPAGGTCESYTGWTYDDVNNKYTKEVSSGTELALPTFTKANRTFKTWRNGAVDVTSPITVTGDVTLTAVWNATVENVIYSWEGAQGGATEVGGTAQSSTNGGSSFDNAQINVAQAGYYCIQLNGKNDYSTNIVEITLSGSEKVKAGDKIRYTGFYNHTDTKNAAPKMRASDGTDIFTGSNLPNINSTSPRTDTHTVPEGINTATVQLTRAQTQSSSFLTKLQIIRPTLVEEANLRTVTFNYNDGGATASTSVEVASGSKVSAPADPTYAHHRFHEWQLGGVAYDFATAVTADITLVADWTQLYTVTYAKGEESATGDAPTQAEKAEGETFKVAANTFAVAGKDFDKWNDGTNDYNPDDTYTVGTENVVLTAQWKAASAKYTVVFKDGDTELGTKLFEVGSNPSDAEIDKTKPLFTFAAWQKDEADIALDAEFWATVVKDATVTLTARWTKAYAQSIDMEQFVIDNTKAGNWHAYLDSKGYAYASSNMSLDSLDGGKTKNNYQYLGLKFNKNSENTYVEGNLQAQKLMIVKVGAVGNNTYMKIDGAKVAEPAIVGGVEADSAAAYTYWYYDTDKTFSLFHENGGTSMLKGITITDPFEVSFDANGGDPVSAQYGHPSVILPSASKGTDSFLGWFIGEDKIGEAGDSYTPTADVELVAHWEAVSTDARLASITFSSDAGTLSPAFDPEVVNYTYTMPYPTAAIPTITSATSVNANAQTPIIGDAAAAWGDAQTIQGVAQSGDKKTYTITMLQAPKDGVCLIKGNVGNNTFVIDEEASLLSGTPSKSNVKTESSTYETLTGWKFNSRPGHLGLTLSEGAFLENDVVEVFVTTVTDDYMRVFDANDVADEHKLAEGAVKMVQGKNQLVLQTGTNTASLYLVRGPQDAAYDMWNPYVAYFAVYRPMMPELTAISFNGEAATKGTGNAYSVTLPEATTDLADLTIVPTIIRNAAHATTPQAVISNEGAWVEGANTYRVMDKDGDYTDYTITITLQGAAETPVITADPATQAYCAGSEPTLTVAANEPSDGGTLHYAWFKVGEADEAVGEDAASYTVAAAGTYYVIVTNKKEGKLDASATSENAVVTLNAPASITTQPSDLKKQIEGANITLSVVAANATAYQWYSCDNKDKENPSLIAGADEAEYEFAAAAGFFYCEVTGLCGAIESNVAQVTVKRSAGCQYITATSGYEATLADGLKIFGCGSDGKTSETAIFQEATANAKSVDADAVGSINKQYFIVQFPVDVEEFTLYGYNSSDRSIANIRVSDHIGATSADKFTDDMEVDATKTANRDNKDISMTAVLDEPISKENYAYIKFSSSLEVYRICYTAAIAEPKLPTLSNQELCAGAAYETFDATITNAAACEGTVSYAWYSTANSEAPVATTATFTPSEDGEYYVKVTHAKAGHISRVTQSAELSVAHYDALALVSYSDDVFQHMGTEATLSVVATGKNVAYVWYTCSNAAGDDAVAITPAETESSLTIASILEGVRYYKVVISHDCDATTLSHVFKVEGWNQLEQVDVTASTVWDMTNVSANHIELTGDDKNARLLLANIDGVNNTTFNAQALMFEGQHIGRTDKSVKHLAGRYVQFNVTVPGAVFVTFESNGNNARTISINGKKCARTTSGTAANDYITYALAVEPGSVEIIGYEGESANQYVRISKIEFKAEYSYRREVNPSYLGTLCWTNNAVLGGATLYEFAGKNENNYLVFDEVEENRLEAGKPYIFMPENGNTEIKVYNTDNEDALTEADLEPVNNMYGTITGKTLVLGVDDNMYYFSSNHIWAVKDFAVNIPVPAYYCYVDYAAVLADEPAPAPAPGRRRVTMGVNGKGTATGIDAINASEKPMKLIIDGQMFILRGQKMFDATGRLVK